MTDTPGRAALRAALVDALDRVDGERSVTRAFETAEGDAAFVDDTPGSVHVLALGKAAAPMARAAHARLGRRAARGLVVTKEGHAAGFDAWPVVETAHPIPDARCAEAGRRVLGFAAEVPAQARLLVLLSGGTSALVATPVDGLALDDLARTSEALLASGAPIEEMNVVRKRLAAVAAGRLAAASPARRIDVWIVSDVVGDDVASIASGPCTPDPSDFGDALRIVERRGVLGALPASVRGLLEGGATGARRDAPAEDDPLFARVHPRLVARNRDALDAAAARLDRAGARVHVLGDRLTGEAHARGRQIACLSRALAASGSMREPIALVVGGETTVRLGDQPGQGGRNQELALAAALDLEGEQATEIAVLAAGSDGTDGPTDAAGGLVDVESAARMRASGIDPASALARHDALPALEASDDLLRTGPTGTNVMDLTLVWIGRHAH